MDDLHHLGCRLRVHVCQVYRPKCVQDVRLRMLPTSDRAYELRK